MGGLFIFPGNQIAESVKGVREGQVLGMDLSGMGMSLAGFAMTIPSLFERYKCIM